MDLLPNEGKPPGWVDDAAAAVLPPNENPPEPEAVDAALLPPTAAADFAVLGEKPTPTDDEVALEDAAADPVVPAPKENPPLPEVEPGPVAEPDAAGLAPNEKPPLVPAGVAADDEALVRAGVLAPSCPNEKPEVVVGAVAGTISTASSSESSSQMMRLMRFALSCRLRNTAPHTGGTGSRFGAGLQAERRKSFRSRSRFCRFHSCDGSLTQATGRADLRA